MLTNEEISASLLLERLGLTAYIAVITREFSSAEDIFKEVCVEAVGRAERFGSITDLRQWTRLSGRNRALERVRTRDGVYSGFNMETLAALEGEWAQPPEETSAEALEALARCLGEMPANNMEMVQLHYFEGCSGAEVARRMGRDGIYQGLARIHRGLGQCVRQKLAEA